MPKGGKSTMPKRPGARPTLERWEGQESFVDLDKLDEMLSDNNRRRTPLVDVDLIATYVVLFAEAMCEENWPRLLELTRNAYLEAQTRRRKAMHRSEAMDLPLEMTSLSPRALSILNNAGLSKVHQLVGKSRDQILEIPQVGPYILAEIEGSLRDLGFDKEGRWKPLPEIGSEIGYQIGCEIGSNLVKSNPPDLVE